ncbi:lecithin retinol acyltransferase-like [Physella acuta]|uniref:lecithin retinol acyltransferase-like n=1 Tax=Physella acuta TaxID=109671 RepID=UPI0027DCDFFD|nr:lecithin retinol acyltransferase-like [Physella acuta]
MGSGYSVDEHNQNLLQHLIPGDVVAFTRGSFTEYALFVGNSKVIPIYCSTLHYAATDLKAMTLDFITFANGDKAEKDKTGRYDLLVEDFIESYNKAFVDQLHQGDLVKFHKRFYTHWAVYVGNRMVIHMAGNVKNLALQKADVVELSLKRAADGSMAFLGNEMDGQWKPLPPAHIVKRARAQIGEVYYNILCHNCEHFAKWCRYNRDRSGQAEKYFPKRMCQLLVLTGDYREPVTYTQTDGGDYVYSSSACPIF